MVVARVARAHLPMSTSPPVKVPELTRSPVVDLSWPGVYPEFQAFTRAHMSAQKRSRSDDTGATAAGSGTVCSSSFAPIRLSVGGTPFTTTRAT